MSTTPIVVAFPESSDAEANRLAGLLANELKDYDGLLTVEQRRVRADTQDMGTTVAIVLGSASITAVARGIAAWVARTGTILEIGKDGGVTAKNIDGRDLEGIMKALEQSK